MSDREVRMSPDGDVVAIRSDYDEDTWQAWMCADGRGGGLGGGSWATAEHVAEWTVIHTPA